MKIKIIERFLRSKSGHLNDCEDSIFVNENFIAVIDGASSKTKRTWGGDTLGRIAGNLITESLGKIPACATAREAVDIMTDTIHSFYKRHKLLQQLKIHPELKATASFALLSLERKEVWLVGDCQILLNGNLIRNEKKIDFLLSEVRSIYLETALLSGKTKSQLLKHDEGRDYILPLLRRQQFYQNDLSKAYWYSAIDGFYVPNQGILIKSITQNTKSVVLATDGYIKLYNSLSDSEAELRKIVDRDPLLFRSYKSTKGRLAGQVSFDDRAYIRVAIR